MPEQTEYGAIAEQVATALKKYLPDFRKPGGIAALTLHAVAPIGGSIFNGRKGAQPFQISVTIAPDCEQGVG